MKAFIAWYASTVWDGIPRLEAWLAQSHRKSGMDARPFHEVLQ